MRAMYKTGRQNGTARKQRFMGKSTHSLQTAFRKAYDRLPASLRQFLKFGLIGALNTVLSYLITNACYYGLRLHEQLCNLITFLITVLISYLLNSRFVFRKEDGEGEIWYKSLAKVYASYAITELALVGILLFVQERLFGIPHFIATFLNLCLTVPLNFLLNKFWAYRKHSRNP